MRTHCVSADSPHRRQFLAATASAVWLSPQIATGQSRAENVFALGVASGHPRPDSVVLWTRLIGPALAMPVAVKWELAEDESFGKVIARGTEVAVSEDAFCVHAEPSGLEAGRTYHYRFEALGARSPVGRTRTAPGLLQASPLRIALASCQRFDTGHYAAWRHAAQRPLDLVIFVGDYIYEYPTRVGAIRPVGERVETLADFRDRYAVHRSDPSLQAAHAMHPWLVIWDDHEVDNDYAALTGQSLQPDFERYRADAYRAWWEHMPVPKAWRPRSGAMRIHDRFDWGRLARIHLLDTRQYRDPQACPRPGRAGSNSVTLADCPELPDSRRSMLGAEQERWVAAGLDTDRRWNLIAQTTLMARSAFGSAGNERHWTDGWDGYPAARARLLETIRERRTPGALVLGGDIHTHAVADLRVNFDDPKSPTVATEFCCTSISSLGPPQTRVNASREANPHIRYARADRRGYIELSLDHREARADLIAVDDPADPMSACRVDARFVVDADRPGAQPA